MNIFNGHALPVRIRALSKHYASVKAVDDVSLDIEPGEFLTLLGPSGSGKTTLLMMIAGFSRPNEGSIEIGGEEIVHLPPHKRNIGIVFQNYALFPHMNVAENIAYPLRLRKVARAERDERVKRVLDLVQLEGYGDRQITQLSGGQRQRIALARAIVFEPRILLMDEPLSALDKQLRESMQHEIRSLHDRLGMTTVSVTHDQREALTMSDRIAVFSNGRLMQVASPSELYSAPKNRFVATFVGETSFLPLARQGEHLTYDGRPVRCAQAAEADDQDAHLLIRPEWPTLVPAGSGCANDANVFSGEVLRHVFQGDSVLCHVRLSGGEVVDVRLPNRAREEAFIPEAGTSVDLVLHPCDTRVVAAEA